MADHELRELERRWRASGDPGDEAAWLLARLRSGSLPLERIEIAALLGHEPAVRVLAELDPGSEAPALLDARTRTLVPDERWLIRELWSRSREATLRFAAAVALNRIGLRHSAAFDRLRAAVAASESWLLCPCATHHAVAALNAREVWGHLSAGTWGGEHASLAGAAFAAALAAELAGENAKEPRFLFGLLSHEAEGDRARAQAEVVGWALGQGDPLADRAKTAPEP